MNKRKSFKVTFEFFCKKPSEIKVMNYNFIFRGQLFPV